MGAVTWTAYGSADTLIVGTSLNAVSDGSGVVGSEIDNSTDRKRFMDVRATMNSEVTAVGTDARIDLYLVVAMDGTNYTDPGDTASEVPETYYVGHISSVKRGGTVQAFNEGDAFRIEIPPQKFKIIAFNELGAAFPTSDANSLSGYRYNETVA